MLPRLINSAVMAMKVLKCLIFIMLAVGIINLLKRKITLSRLPHRDVMTGNFN